MSSLSTTLDRAGEHMGPGDAMLSYLPLAHIFDRWVTWLPACADCETKNGEYLWV